MAWMTPNRITSDMLAMSGEVKTWQALAKGLDNNWFVWFDVGIGNKEVYPDFILIHPQYGLIVLEVKDVPFKNLKSIAKTTFTSSNRSGTNSFKNPIKQARNYVFSVINDKRLKEKVPYHYAVVFANMTASDLENPIDGVAISELIDEKLTLTKEHLNKNKINSKILSIVETKRRKTNISKDTFNMLRMIIDPSIVVAGKFVKKPTAKQKEGIPAVLDLKQERAAKSIGEGHRLLRGIAGSGKTTIMVLRAKYLVKKYGQKWNVLYVCWNRALVNDSRQKYDSIDMVVEHNNVEFTHYSKWMKGLAWDNNIQMPKVKDSGKDYEEEFNEVAKKLAGMSFSSKYQAILIDEAQDFEEDYIRLLLNHLDPETNSLLIGHDYAQNLRHKEISWKNLGISVSGSRTLDLSHSSESLGRNYRNTLEITRFAKFIYNDNIPTKDENDNISTLTKMDASPDRGPLPSVELVKDRYEESRIIIDWILKIKKENNLSYHDFLIFYPGKRLKDFYLEDDFFKELDLKNIPFTWIAEDQDSKSNYALYDNTIKISSFPSGKGMDYEAVAVIACDCIFSDEPEAELYTSATRARKYLIMTTGGSNHKVEKILDYSYQSSVDWLDKFENK